MDSTNEECDYEAISKAFAKNDVINKNLDETREALFSEFENQLNKNFFAKNKYDHAEALNNHHHVTISNNINLTNAICDKYKMFDEKLKNLQQLQQETDLKKRKIVSEFCGRMEEVYGNLQKLEQEFSNDNMKERIKDCLEKRRICDERIPKLQNEIESMKEALNNLEPCEIPNITKITKLIQQESITHLGEPLKIQHRLCAIRQNNEILAENYMK